MVDGGQNVLSIRGLSVDYRTPKGPIHALRNVDLDVPKGSIVGIVGESGCGKSSLISSIIRQYPENAEITQGAVEFAGQSLLDLPANAMRKLMGDRMSVVFQDPMSSLNPIRSIGRQMIDIQYRTQRSRSEKRQIAIEMLRRVGVSDAKYRLKQHAFQFSGGMRQRISIAMALMARPDLLIADEPTTALDATLELQIIDLLRDLQSELGCSILFVSHHLGMIADLCDYVVVLYAGEVIESGTVRDIFHRSTHPYTRRLLECDPGLIAKPTRHLPTIPGDVPNLRDVPPGCIFVDRCTDRFSPCRTKHPSLFEVGPEHRASCHLVHNPEGSA